MIRRTAEVIQREVVIESEHAADFEAWRRAARVLLRDHVRPDVLRWRLASDTQRDLLCATDNTTNSSSEVELGDNGVRVPQEFLRMAASVACHSDSARWDALYRVLFRMTHGEPSLLDVATDPDIHRLFVMDKAVRRDVHKLHAFVRFRAVEQPCAVGSPAASTHYIAWFEPHHHIVRRATPFFARRFPSMQWSVLTSAECAHWNGEVLRFTEGVSRAHSPKEDELEDLWRSYYAHIFNPARVATATMQAEMPQRYWVNLPEARLISDLTRNAPARVLRMLQQLNAVPAEIPDDIRSRIGEVSEPERNAASVSRDGMQAVSARSIDVDLETAGAWDPIHDPGVTVARGRTDGVDGCANAALIDGTEIRIGTASWTDPTLLRCGAFYPYGVTTPEARLRFYASQFSLVEVDSTYYVPPTRAMAAAWAERSPDSFVFDIKAFALMTGHAADVKRMPDWLRRQLPPSVSRNERVYGSDLPTHVVDDVWQRFQHALSPLRDVGKLGPILLQFPRWFVPTRENAALLRTARERLGDSSAAVEFRNPEWVAGRMAARTAALLESLNFTYVVVDAPPGTGSSMPPVALLTSPDLAVIRLHGRRTDTWEAKHNVVSERYRYLYDRDQLNEWSDRIAGIAQQLVPLRTNFPDMAKAKQGVHVVFNNCHANYGTTNAIEITKTLIEFDKVRRRQLPLV